MTMAVDIKAAMNALDDDEVFDYLVQALVESGTRIRAAVPRPALDSAAATRIATNGDGND
jgi:hypothetical protein